ncbi:hypothetical protein IMG5_055110 [Ichthyophthirius multifiliis]|uniref:Transmembrane protein n=1 Tax=Ichthyophthirius multifiliis TaxID=5932 RepID=G0QN39_ICHMU|nr:hypothetical protein IMG5_055110 [Ichthyophthirius multifiliis]EGR33368.1 hypothetical protein IMG5_055110 [Ichthyophthirius multifiliis]|eukprot:XP_004037354.1 hypothetical protein IMG5_055110 [Ichthyophthirius multifiliis]
MLLEEQLREQDIFQHINNTQYLIYMKINKQQGQAFIIYQLILLIKQNLVLNKVKELILYKNSIINNIIFIHLFLLFLYFLFSFLTKYLLDFFQLLEFLFLKALKKINYLIQVF